VESSRLTYVSKGKLIAVSTSFVFSKCECFYLDPEALCSILLLDLRKKDRGSVIINSEPTTSAAKLDNQLIQKFDSVVVPRIMVQRIHRMNCIGVPSLMKSIVL
jgi:hypothetical protein